MSRHPKRRTLWFSGLWCFKCSSLSPIWVIDMRFVCLMRPHRPYYMSANSKGYGETALLRRLAPAFAGRLCNKYPMVMCLQYMLSFNAIKLVHIYLSHNFKKRTIRRSPSEDSNQPAHSRILIRIFTGHILNSRGCKKFFMRKTNTDRVTQICKLISAFVGRTCPN